MFDKQTHQGNLPLLEPTSSATVVNRFGSGATEDFLFRNRMPKAMHWSVPWSDLMMTMFILFAILYIYHSSGYSTSYNKKKDATTSASRESKADQTIIDTDNISETLEASISDVYGLSKETVHANNLEDLAFVALVPNKAVRIILTDALLFDTGHANLRPEAKRLLGRIATIIRKTSYMVNVVGYTDDVPINTEKFPSNWELSAIRASKVARFLIEEMGIQGRRFVISGHSHYQPVFPNDSAENRAANRRVELIITKGRLYSSTKDGENPLSQGLLDQSRQSRANSWLWDTFQ